MPVRARPVAVLATFAVAKVASAIVLTLLVTPLFLLMHGKDAIIPKGQSIIAFVDDDVDVPLPAMPPPAEN